ncbi:elongation factor G [Ruminococcus sp. YE282]|uniref:elongation factor G n=1 Tax=Ruminococcus sp. YE282 TaxID=3158780 RepID=UPI0008826A3E|nr:elongation factor G [Ruminococcus bromii]MDY4084220.1 elongation factor G [Ruminococcus bromii]MDY4711579.1 elongation factor G [Ruminococcus bromii]MEE3497756.1 elongation factor G [Ruminococcus bromii]SCX75454.1 translation elongation factor 2 (EF-2/EF-G) [Ruminococcus bromii]
MKQYDANKILNIALVGHSGCGKTSVAESILYLSKATERLGSISDGNTTLDFDSEEIKRQASIMTAVAPIEWKNTKINLIDTPGLFDFAGGVSEGMRAADTALIVVSGKDGVNVGTEKAAAAATKAGLTKVFFVNGLCDEDARFYRVFENLKATFGPSVCPVVVPYIVDGKANTYVNLFDYKAYEYGEDGSVKQTALPDMGTRLEGLREAIKEAVAETSEDLLDKFIMGEEFTPEEIILGVSQGVKDGTICPVFCGDAHNTFAIDQLLNSLTWLAPNAASKGEEIGVDVNGEPVEVSINDSAAAAAIVFKTVVDPFIGRLSYIKTISGKICADTPVINMRTGAQERIGKVMYVCGKKQVDAEYIGAGDIGAIPKLVSTKTGDTLCSPLRKVVLDGVDYPASSYTMAIYPAKKGDEDKVAQGIAKLADEDPTIKFENNHETHEMLISGLGEQHLDVVISRLKTKYNVDANLKKPKIAYRETIRKKVTAQGRYKKQSGGHGQFGDVWIEFEPYDTDGLEFAERVVGGAVPKNFFPAVEKGLRESIKKGVLAGYPTVGIKATLYDGSYHPVDSSEMSFKTAASLAYKNGIPNASPTLLEPIGSLRATVPDSNMGDVMGEVNKRRGRVLGMSPAEGGMQVVEAEVPVAEMSDFSTFIKQITQGRGSYEFSFVRYEDAPANIAQKVIEQAKKEAEE